MRCSSSSIPILLITLAFAICGVDCSGWKSKNFTTLVTFGDSYSDESRLGYFINNNGSAPPVGWEQPVGLNTASGGLSWARLASIYSSTKLYNYAVSGAVCSNKISPRTFAAIKAPFPDVAGYEIPAFKADSRYISRNGTAFFSGTPENTVYAIWIGTNDLGNDAFLTDSQIRGKTLKDYVDCVYSAIDSLYENGGRYFVLLNVAPLQLLPQYATPENGGLNATKFYPDKGSNITEISYRMYESVTTVNEVFKYRTPFETELEKRWKDAQIANYDVNALITDIWNDPKSYLNGTASLNVTAPILSCDATGDICTNVEDKSARDSYLWFDELHPSEQASRIVAREFVGVLSGQSKWAKYWG
ncbi:carbohydrate esterase family 16 protein [Aaosphaeria arxii CBS 175.79]|uniref:Carbohydrate esterase family 16 protein n=1 Tax=Aaosphaeria arxii CBS 175.79 TaxID=1450172 RepID=A0A6A5Y285_9PLEO|nr:carbohydrate esterase family 16 protein [Aaosphaeria arxii CBS 175.79]KAF2019333.1 carbohydrate esterase family 16 protein [Aaosphaeria arxii CBS 175.79]